MRKKLLSLLLAALMILGLLPAAALAAEGDAAPAAPVAEEEVISAPAEENAPVTQAAEEDAAPAVQAVEDVAVQADEETVTPPVEADDSGSDNAITVTVDGTAYEVKDTGTVTADSKAAPIYKVVVPNGTAAVTGHWGMLVTRGSVACLCGACTVSLSELKASNGTFTLPLTGHSGEEAAAVSKGYFATAEALQNIKDQSYQKMVFAWMRCKDADGNWCYALLCVEIEGVTNTAPALASGVTLYTVVAPDGETYTTDVTKFFTDEDAGDTLTYYVSVNGGTFEKLEKPEAYTYTYGENFVNARLTFKANDGKADSLQNCTVILNNPEYPVVKGADSSTTNTETGKAVQLSIGTLITSPKSYGLYYFVSVDGGEYKQVTLSSNKYTYAPTKAGTHTLLFKASTAKTLEDGKTSGVYTWTVAATGADINNHAPVVKNPTEGPGQLGSSVNVTYWKPDLASIFSDPDGDTLTYSYSIDGSDFSEYYPTVGIHADYLKPDGTHTVTIRATDPYGEYAEFTVTIEKSTNHAPTKKADAPGKLSVFVPVGLTYKVDANLYYEDVDAKDQGNLIFKSYKYGVAGSYTATTAGDTMTETAYGADSVDRSVDGIEITYTAIGIDKEDTATTGVAYTIDPAALGLNIPGNYKVRVSSGTTGGAEQSFNDTYAFIAKTPGTYVVHIYGDKTSTAEENYVVKLTVTGDYLEWPTIEKFELSTVTGAAVDGEDGNQTLTVKDIQIEQYEKLKDSTDGSKKIAGCITVTLDDSFVTKNRAQVKTGVNAVTLTASDGATAGNTKPPKIFQSENDYTVEAAYYASQGSVQVWYTVKFVEPKSNTPPTLAEGVKTSVSANAYETVAYTVDLSTIFADEDGDTLAYYVSVNDGEFEAADAKYSYTPATTENSVKLIFKANDGKVDSSDTYTVSLKVKHTPTRLVESGSGSAAAGAYANVYLSSVFQDEASIFTSLDYYVSIDGGEEFFFLRSAKRGAQFSRAFETAGEHTLKFRAALGPLFSDVYTYTLTVTGESVTNYKPYILDTAKDEERTEAMWTGGGSYYTNWKPDLSKVFGDDLKDTGDNGEQSRLTFTFKDDKDPSFRTYYPNTGYATGASKSRVGERTVTFRATDPYGEYVEWVTHVTVMEDHKATRKEGVQEAYTFEVPFGATLALDAGDYFEDNDSKDIGNVQFCDTTTRITYQPYKYVANDPSSDTVIKLFGYSGSDWGSESVTFTFRTVMPTSWPTITDFTVSSMHGVANSDTGAEEGDVAVKAVTVTPYDTLRVANGEAAAGLITIRMDEDVIAAARESYELSAGKATATASTGAAVGVELDDDIFLKMADNYRIAHAVSVSQKIQNETYGEYTLTTCYDLMLIGSNARPILAVENAAVTEKVTQDVAWTIDLNGLFSDADGDPLTYKVSVNGAEAVAFEGSTYTYTPADGIHTLVFTANDGKVGSTDTYTVTLLTRRPNAPAWPQILEFSLENLRTYSGGTVYFPVAKTELVQYDALVTENSKAYAGEIVLHVIDADFASRSWYATDKDAATVKITNGATTTAANAITMRTPSLTTNVTVTEDGQSYYYYMKVVQAEIPAFEPGIGNGTNTGTTENNVTTFPAGSGSGAPTVTVTAPASGWAAGENTFTVACDKACVVLVKSGDTYTKLTASDADGAHSFTATLAEGDEIIVRLKGDVNGDGIVNALDATLVSRACLSTTHGAYKAFDALSTCAVGTPSALVAMQINRACLSETHAAYQAMTW